jgi:hypothetical protein
MAAKSLAYIPGCRHDLFVSYAWVDDRVPGAPPEEPGWVHALADNLGTLLAQQLGRADWGDIWIDTRIDRTQAITPEVLDALQHSALLLIVLSEGWLESPWCRHELETFLARHTDGERRGRIFVVHRTQIPPERRPEAIRDLIGFDLFELTRDRRERPLGFPVASATNPADRPYFERVDDLSRDLGERLRALRAATGSPPPKAPVPEALQSAQSGAANQTTEPPSDDLAAAPGAIYIAEGTPDLRVHRDRLSRQLDQSGFAVRPASLLPAAPDDYRDAATRELAMSRLFVQLLGPYTLDKRPDLPQGHEALQLELAELAGLPILRWMDPGVDQEALDDPELFARREVIVGGFDDFKRQVEATMRGLLRPAPVAIAPDTDSQVLIRAAEADEEAAYTIGDRLLARGVGYEVADQQDPLGELVREAPQPYQGLMVVYDRCERAWAQAQVKECRVIALAPEGRHTTCAVLDPEREGKRRLGIRIPRFHWLTHLDDPGFNAFVQAVAGGGE